MNEALRNGRLGGHDPAELAGRFGTPFFAYDLDSVTVQVDGLRACSRARSTSPMRSRPTQPLDPASPRKVSGWGRRRIRRGVAACSAGRVPAGPRGVHRTRQTRRGVRGRRRTAVGIVTVESVGELRRLAAIAEVRGRRQPIRLRAAVGEGSNGADASGPRRPGRPGLAITGKFGMDPGDLHTAGVDAVASPWLEPLGIHAFGASNEPTRRSGERTSSPRSRRRSRSLLPPASRCALSTWAAGWGSPMRRVTRRSTSRPWAAASPRSPTGWRRRRPRGPCGCCSSRATFWSGRVASMSHGSWSARPWMGARS